MTHRASAAFALAIASALALAAALAPLSTAQAQSAPDPRDDDIFGSSDDDDPSSAAKQPSSPIDFDQALVDPLQIGGQIYLRSAWALRQGEAAESTRFSMPSFVDLYLDTRPSERVRGFVSGRLYYDPTQISADAAIPLFTPPDNPRAVLDQLWLRFDAGRVVYFTVGSQRIRWGPAFLWNPVDIVHPERRNPVVIFDERVGTTLIKAHVPIESLGWNFYAIALVDDASRIERIGGAFRAEFVVDTVEMALSAAVRKEQKPKFGFDISAGIWEIDVYGEAALHLGSNRRRFTGPFDAATLTPPAEEDVSDRLFVEATGGIQWSTLYNDKQLLTVGAEYNFNSFGYSGSDLYPALLTAGEFIPFYTGRHYAAVFLNIMAPESWANANFTLFTLGNLSDRSFATRLNATFQVLPFLQLETVVGVHYGNRAGELRLELDIPGVIHLRPQLVDLGLNLRVRM